jgi:hypothetical protein
MTKRGSGGVGRPALTSFSLALLRISRAINRGLHCLISSLSLPDCCTFTTTLASFISSAHYQK